MPSSVSGKVGDNDEVCDQGEEKGEHGKRSRKSLR